MEREMDSQTLLGETNITGGKDTHRIGDREVTATSFTFGRSVAVKRRLVKGSSWTGIWE